MRLNRIFTPILFLLVPIVSFAQTVNSNVANFDDPRIIFVSAAATAFQRAAQIVAGYEIYYAGLGGRGLQNGFAAFILPHDRFGTFSLSGQYFASDIYRHGNFSFGYGSVFLNGKISLGVDLGMLSFSFNQDNFRLQDLNDPVFRDGASKNALDLGVSFLANPINPLYLGIAVKHLNQPNISLADDDVHLPPIWQTSFMFKNSWLSPLLNLEYIDQEFNFDLGLEKWFFDRRSILRINYSRFNLEADAGFFLPLANNWLHFEYEYRHPLSELSHVSSASHQFIIAYGFPMKQRDYELTTQPNSQTIYAGESAKYLAHLLGIGNFNSPINLTITNLDSHITASFVPEKVRANTSSKLILMTSKKSKVGTYNFHVIASADGKVRTTPIRLEVKRLPLLSADVSASVDRLVIQEMTKIRSRDPLLPYIFFAENQFALNPERYVILNPDQNPVKNFSFFPERLLDISSKYQNTLNVIAKRLWDHREMEIVVRGYNSNWGIEQGNLELSQRRAEAVQDYLIKNCGVRPEQIKVEAHHLPPDPASNLDPRGREENQRVEITCPIASQPILDPIVTETSEIATSDARCSFQIKNLIAEAGLKNRRLTITTTSGDTFKLFEGKTIENEVMWDWKNDIGQSVEVGKTYQYQLRLTDVLGQVYATPLKSIQIQKVSSIEHEYIQKNIEKTRLILFKYDRADMDLTMKSLQEELQINIQKVRENPQATLLIQGYTDVIGDPDYNLRLSLRRAEAVTQYFIERGISKSRMTFQGFGMSRPLLANHLPEGRMMNRRVEIYILY